MPARLLKILPLGVFGSLIVVLTVGVGSAQQPFPGVSPNQPVPQPLPVPGQPMPPAQGDGMDVLAKGPVHEAFASTAEMPAASSIVTKQPPDPIDELPPDQKPEGDNVQWIPGYWHWDEDTSQFIWISGFWRQPPPGRVWVPGAWRSAASGWQWVPGFWQGVAPNPQVNQQVQPEIQYLPQPPASIEVGPTTPAPSATSVYAPGAWVWRGKYVWRPGVWVEYRANWIWVPARYYWTPAGFVFVEGYWDYPLATRGVLFAPVAFARPIYTRPAFVYTPVYVVSEPAMVGALFVRRGCSSYYFGDYFGNQYTTLGFSAWCGTNGRAGFSIGFGVGRSWGYDPLWSYYSVAYRGTPAWQRGVGELYHGRYRGELVRPPTTLVQQNTTIVNITKVNGRNVTSSITVVNGRPMVNNKDVSGVAMIAPLKVAPALQRTKFQTVSIEVRRNEAVAARQIREVAVERTRLETRIVAQPAVRPGPGQPVIRPQSIRLEVPKSAVIRAQVREEKFAPPPHPHHAEIGPGPRIEPKQPIRPTPKFEPKPRPERKGESRNEHKPPRPM